MTGLIVNAGSDLPQVPRGWTNTYEQAQIEARQWLDRMTRDGFGDIEMIDNAKSDGSRWEFIFRHKVTKVEVRLQTHGINDMVSYLKQAIFEPRVYWNGSSSSTPTMDDFAKEGFVMTFRATKPAKAKS